MKLRWFVLMIALLLGIAASASAQPSLLVDVQIERAKYPGVMAPADVAQLLNAVAWKNKDAGWGLLRKGSGNSCPLNGVFISCDILVNKNTIHHFDVLRDWEGSAQPTWNDVGPCVLSDSSGCEMSRFQEPFAPAGSPTPTPGPGPQPTPIPVPTPTLSYLTVEQFNAFVTDWANRDNRLVGLIEADHQDHVALAAQIKQHDEDPSWMAKLFGNRYVQIALGAFGTYLGTQAAK